MENLKSDSQTIIVTGGASGIGKATVEKFAHHNYTVIIADINDELANALVTDLKTHNNNIEYIRCDVSDEKSVDSLFSHVTEKYDKLDILVNNAGIANKNISKTADHSIEDWNRVISINQTGVFHCMKKGLQIMEEQGYGNVINVSSLAGIKASGNNLAYAASKYAVVGMTKASALEYARKNIRINAVCPGYTETPLLQGLFKIKPNWEEKFKSFTPMQRFGRPEEIADVIYWLSGEQSTYITGQTICIDGGLSL